MTESVEGRFSTFVHRTYGRREAIFHQPWSGKVAFRRCGSRRSAPLLTALCRNGTVDQRLASEFGLSGRPEMV